MLENYIEADVVRAIVIFIGFALLGLLFQLFWKKLVTRAAIATSHKTLDGSVVEGIGGPLNLVIVLVGAYLAFKELDMLKDHSVIAYNIFYVLFLLLAALVISRVLKGIIDKWLEVRRHYTRIPELINKFITIMVYIIVIFMILMHFKIEITPLLATLGLGGLAAGLALQKTLSDFFAGIHIISDRPINVGNYIAIDEEVSGWVEDIGWRSTRIRTLRNDIIVVPNSKLAESILVNHSMPVPELSILVECGVAYGSDLEKVEKVTVEVAKNVQKQVEGAVEDFEPFIRYHTFGESNIQFSTILRVKNYVDKWKVKHEFIKRLKKRYEKEKIEISWPVRKIYTSTKKVS